MLTLGKEVKIVYVDGSLSNGITRFIRGKIIDETNNSVTIKRRDGQLTIGKNFVVKIEERSVLNDSFYQL